MAFPTKAILPGYVSVMGAKYVLVYDFTGPTSYSRTTGIVVRATDLGMGGFDFATATSDTGNNFDCQIQMNLAGYGNAVPSIILRPVAIATATVGGQSQTA